MRTILRGLESSKVPEVAVATAEVHCVFWIARRFVVRHRRFELRNTTRDDHKNEISCHPGMANSAPPSSSHPLSPFSPLHRSRDFFLDPPPSRIDDFSIANLSAWSILTSSPGLLFGCLGYRTGNRCSSHAQPVLVFLPADTHASSREAYKDGKERV